MSRLIRWVGDPLVWNDPIVVKGLLTQRLPPTLVERLTEFERHQRVCAIPGHSELSLGPAHGFSRTYVFGPQRFVVEMEDADAARLFANEWDRWQFIDVTDNPAQTQRSPLGKGGWKSLTDSFAKLGRNRKLLPQYR